MAQGDADYACTHKTSPQLFQTMSTQPCLKTTACLDRTTGELVREQLARNVEDTGANTEPPTRWAKWDFEKERMQDSPPGSDTDHTADPEQQAAEAARGHFHVDCFP